MGSTFSKTASPKTNGIERRGVENSLVKCRIERLSERFDKKRLKLFIEILLELSSLQDDATKTQVDAREKRREAGLQREEVGICDDNFMKMVRKLIAQGLAREFEELIFLADRCQEARNELGPLEQQGNEAEQHWEGKIGDLQEAQDNFVSEFQMEFEMVDGYIPSQTATSTKSSVTWEGHRPNISMNGHRREENHGVGVRPLHSVASESSFVLRPDGAEIRPPRISQKLRDQTLSDLDMGLPFEMDPIFFKSEPRFEELDLFIDNEVPTGLPSQAQQNMVKPFRPPDIYLPLLDDFRTPRERINKWIEQKVLVSRLESTYLFNVLGGRLESENVKTPSNWSQLVIAYWSLDGAADTRNRDGAKGYG